MRKRTAVRCTAVLFYPFSRCATAPPRGRQPSQSSLRDASSPEGGALFVLTGRCPKAPPSGELARERLRGFCPLKACKSLSRSAALSQKAALQMPLSFTTPFVKMGYRKGCGCVAMKAPVGLSSGGVVCVSRWRGFAPTNSAGVSVPRNLK